MGARGWLRLVIVAGLVGAGCNSLVGNEAHQLAPAGSLGGKAGAVPAGGGAGGHGGAGAGGAGGAPGAAGDPGGGAPGNGGSVGNGGTAVGGSVGTGGVVATGGVVGTGGLIGTGGVVATGGVPGRGGASGTGGAGGMCVAPGATCAASTDCCQTGATSPTGAVCISDDNLCHAKCTTGTQCKSGCCAPVMNETYGVCADAATYCPVLKGVGDPCTVDAECASGSCSAWCQATCGAGNSLCSSTSSRLNNSQGEVNWCVYSNANSYSCFPGCVFDSDCAVYGAGHTCKVVTDVDGLSDFVCSL